MPWQAPSAEGPTVTTELQSSEEMAAVQASTALEEDRERALHFDPAQQVGSSSAMHCESV